MMLFRQRILPAVKGLRIPTRSCYHKKVPTKEGEKLDRRIATALFMGGTLGGLGFAREEYLNTYSLRLDFVERVLKITASGMVGFGLGGFTILLSPILLSIGLAVGIIDYLYPPPSETDM